MASFLPPLPSVWGSSSSNTHKPLDNGQSRNSNPLCCSLEARAAQRALVAQYEKKEQEARNEERGLGSYSFKKGPPESENKSTQGPELNEDGKEDQKKQEDKALEPEANEDNKAQNKEPKDKEKEGTSSAPDSTGSNPQESSNSNSVNSSPNPSKPAGGTQAAREKPEPGKPYTLGKKDNTLSTIKELLKGEKITGVKYEVDKGDSWNLFSKGKAYYLKTTLTFTVTTKSGESYIFNQEYFSNFKPEDEAQAERMFELVAKNVSGALKPRGSREGISDETVSKLAQQTTFRGGYRRIPEQSSSSSTKTDTHEWSLYEISETDPDKYVQIGLTIQYQVPGLTEEQRKLEREGLEKELFGGKWRVSPDETAVLRARNRKNEDRADSDLASSIVLTEDSTTPLPLSTDSEDQSGPQAQGVSGRLVNSSEQEQEPPVENSRPSAASPVLAAAGSSSSSSSSQRKK